MRALDFTRYGFGQGISLIDGTPYLLFSPPLPPGGHGADPGKAGTIVALDRTLAATWVGTFTRNGTVYTDHPVAIAHRTGYPTLLGVQGKFVVIDWPTFRTDGNLDRAIVREIPDDYAPQEFRRAEYVELDGTVYLATSNYASAPPGHNEILLYDAARLRVACSTGAPGVLARRIPAPDFIQSLVFQHGRLVAVRNRQHTQGWQLDALDPASGRVMESICYDYPHSELEGYRLLPNGTALFLTADAATNFYYTGR